MENKAHIDSLASFDKASELAAQLSEAKQQIAELKAERDALAAELARYSMSAGQADQRRAESRAVRVALGFGENANDVAPIDLLEKIGDLKAQGVEAFAAQRG